MKYLVVGPTYPFRGGIAHHTTLLVKHLLEENPTLLISLKSQYPAFLFPGKTDRDPGRPLMQVSGERLLIPFQPRTWSAVTRRAAQFNPEVVILPWWVPFWAPCWWWLSRRIRQLTGAPVIFYCHNVLPHETKAGIRWLCRKTLGQGDGFVVQDQPDRVLLEELIPLGGRPVRVVKPPGMQALFGPPTGRDEARRRLGLPDQGVVVLFFGLVRPYKGLDVLFRAFARLLERFQARLLVAGEWWTEPNSLLPLIDSLQLRDDVTILDRYIHDEEAGLIFSAADVVVLPYRSGTGSAVAQLALGFNRPVIATRVGSLSETIQDGVNGLLVEPGDPEALGEALVRFFQEGLMESMAAHIAKGNEPSRSGWPQVIQALAEMSSILREQHG